MFILPPLLGGRIFKWLFSDLILLIGSILAPSSWDTSSFLHQASGKFFTIFCKIKPPALLISINKSGRLMLKGTINYSFGAISSVGTAISSDVSALVLLFIVSLFNESASQTLGLPGCTTCPPEQ